jgi:hypothetical protein
VLQYSKPKKAQDKTFIPTPNKFLTNRFAEALETLGEKYTRSITNYGYLVNFNQSLFSPIFSFFLKNRIKKRERVLGVFKFTVIF